MKEKVKRNAPKDEIVIISKGVTEKDDCDIICCSVTYLIIR